MWLNFGRDLREYLDVVRQLIEVVNQGIFLLRSAELGLLTLLLRLKLAVCRKLW
jgi:hypothetical protein